jgi:hypothetical protein
MKKIFLIFVINLILLLTLNKTAKAELGGPCPSGTLTVADGEIEISPDPITYGDTITITLYIHPDEGGGDTFYAIIDPNSESGIGFNAVLTYQSTDSDGFRIISGTFDTSLLDGTDHILAIYPSTIIDDYTKCSEYIDLHVNGAPEPEECPPPGREGTCLCVDDTCYRAGEQPPAGAITEICFPQEYYCDPFNGIVTKRTCSDGGACCFDDDGNPYCTTGEPDFGTGQCICGQIGTKWIGFDCTTDDGLAGIYSAIGCIPIETNPALWKFILRWAIGIAGGIAFLLILYAGFLLITSAGHPKKIQAGKELLISAITGLILLIFAVWLLRIIGADILGIFQ